MHINFDALEIVKFFKQITTEPPYPTKFIRAESQIITRIKDWNDHKSKLFRTKTFFLKLLATVTASNDLQTNNFFVILSTIRN